MVFSSRNPYYLRISKKTVLPVYLYLDDHHIGWMSDHILQHVLEDLRPKILPKLQAEAESGSSSTAKKATVDTHRGENYQFCYFLRKTQPHSVAIKIRSFTAVAPAQKRPEMPPPSAPSSSRQQRKRKPKQSATTTNKRRKVRENHPPDDDDYAQSDDESSDIEMGNEDDGAHADIEIDLTVEEEEKPKPVLNLKYQGFSIFDQCLCIVVEPWPAIRATSRARSAIPESSRASSMPPPEIPQLTAQRRSQTPLFLPDYDERERSVTPLPPLRVLLPVPLFEDSNDDDLGGMMEFSNNQCINTGGQLRAGTLDDEEDMDGAVFFGDADEVRELL